jgi:hypothetical protein
LHLEEAARELLDVDIEDGRTLELSWALSFFLFDWDGLKDFFLCAVVWKL